MKESFLQILILILGLLVFGTLMPFLVSAPPSEIEIESYSVGCEVSQMEYEETKTFFSTKPHYKMGVRNDDFATTLDITADQFAEFIVGDIVEVEVRVYEDTHSKERWCEYVLLGQVIQD